MWADTSMYSMIKSENAFPLHWNLFKQKKKGGVVERIQGCFHESWDKKGRIWKYDLKVFKDPGGNRFSGGLLPLLTSVAFLCPYYSFHMEYIDCYRYLHPLVQEIHDWHLWNSILNSQEQKKLIGSALSIYPSLIQSTLARAKVLAQIGAIDTLWIRVW